MSTIPMLLSYNCSLVIMHLKNKTKTFLRVIIYKNQESQLLFEVELIFNSRSRRPLRYRLMLRISYGGQKPRGYFAVVIIISSLLNSQLKAKREAPAYSRAPRRVRGCLE